LFLNDYKIKSSIATRKYKFANISGIAHQYPERYILFLLRELMLETASLPSLQMNDNNNGIGIAELSLVVQIKMVLCWMVAVELLFS